MNQAFVAVIAFVLFIQAVVALTTEIAPGTTDCYFEELEVGEKITLSYQVGDEHDFGINFWLTDPSGDTIKSTVKVPTDMHAVTANIEGRYTFCFSNEFSTSHSQLVTFNVHENFQKIHDTITESTNPLEKEIAELAESIFNVKAQQEYIVFRERQHRDTAESTNSRVKWWSIAQLGLLISVCFWQVYYLKRFFEVRRVV
ncbi:hypothetical protein K501DRAFT_229863, partial [Backusella circina FSU 941]